MQDDELMRTSPFAPALRLPRRTQQPPLPPLVPGLNLEIVTSQSTHPASSHRPGLNFQQIARAAVPEISGPPGPAMVALQNYFRKFQASGADSQRWFADYRRFREIFKLEISREDFDAIASEGYVDLREWLLAAQSTLDGVSLQAKLRFGFGLFEISGNIDARAALPRIIRGLNRCDLEMASAEARARLLAGGRGRLSLKELLAESDTGPGNFLDFRKKEVPEIKEKPRRRNSNENIKSADLEISSFGKPTFQHHTDFTHAKTNLVPAKKKFPGFTPTHAVLVCQVISLCLVLGLRSLAGGPAISALMDALAAFCGFGALATTGALCLTALLPPADEAVDLEILDP